MAAVTIDELTLADEPARWEELGFDVRDGQCLLGQVRVVLAGQQAGRGVLGWSLRGITDADLDGLPTSISTTSLPEDPAAGAHPNGVLAIDHVVAISPDFERTVARLSAAGLDLRRIREEPTPAGAPRQAFFRLGGVILELVAEPDEVTERNGGSERPAIFWGLALLAQDLASTAAAFEPHVGEPRAAVQPGREIVTLKRSAGLSVPVALITPQPERVER